MGSVRAPAPAAGGWEVAAAADKEGVGMERLVEVAQRAADAAGEVLRKYFRQRVEIIDKEDQSPVTIADREAEEAMVSVILKSFPSHAVFGEENGWRCVEKSADYVWVLDPIDGTKSFVTGKPLFGTLISLLYKGKPVIGIIDQPILRERWVGVDGKKTTLNGQEISVRPCNVLAQAYLYTTSPHLFAGEAEDAFIRVRDKVKVPLYGCDCYAYALLASGFVDLVVESGLKPYDFLSLVPVIEGAGEWTARRATALRREGPTGAGSTEEAYREAACRIPIPMAPGVHSPRPAAPMAAASRPHPRPGHMLVLGTGFVGRYVSQRLLAQGWRVSGTCTSPAKKAELEMLGMHASVFDATSSSLANLRSLQDATHLLISIPPIPGIGDPLLSSHSDLQRTLNDGNLQWLCYFSSTSVYGDCGGAWVDEDHTVNPKSESAKLRYAAEKGWLNLMDGLDLSAFIFRLGGIYGPGRSAVDTITKSKSLSRGQKLRESKQYTARVHVADIYQAILASMTIRSARFIFFSGLCHCYY
ncbi:hypothetical protein E2562_001654 [Oryza meyeriana var. granulata]|uniref:histidinol-phosphatase n=1 Tax=Oryza meyeriana var. granulata TaxID=110450 RepID=A0A6G1CCT9_9ORYZ|nr:hypothetical protein E2562_001654 [Oryza meyeriana var. granulata]